jgi:hypothetical protein
MVGDIIRFRFKGSNDHNDWSPPALIAERFVVQHDTAIKIWVVLCGGLRCMANEDTHEIEIISPADFFPKVVRD